MFWPIRRFMAVKSPAAIPRGEIAPQSPDREKWDIWWFYATGGPGVFKGDVYYYSVDHDSRGIVASMTDTPPIYFMTGEYDGACHPAMSKAHRKRSPTRRFSR